MLVPIIVADLNEATTTNQHQYKGPSGSSGTEAGPGVLQFVFGGFLVFAAGILFAVPLVLPGIIVLTLASVLVWRGVLIRRRSH
jgi:hypothetical protein